MPVSPWQTLHTLLGIFPLGGYLLFHAYEHLAVRAGRFALLERLQQTSSVALEVMCVFVPLLMHAALGFARVRARRASLRSWQPVTGLGTLVFAAYHVYGVWWPRVASGRPAAAYGALVDQVATLAEASLYVVSLSCVCAHFASGLSGALARTRLSPRQQRPLRLGCIGVGVLLWLILIDELAVYATGEALL